MPANKKKEVEKIELSERQKFVLSAVIQSFIARGEPVSSRFIQDTSGIKASSATIRNTMAKLEKLGLIEHPHTSAGRQPTDLGYRVYLNSLIKLEELKPSEKNIIIRQLKNITDEAEILKIASNILSDITNKLSIAATPYLKNGVITKINLVLVAEKKVMLILSISDGLIRSLMIEMEIDINYAQLEAISSILNERLVGRPVSFLNTFVINEIENVTKGSFQGPIRIFTRSIMKLMSIADYENVEVSGTKNIVKQPEFAKIEDIEGMIEFIDDKKMLVHFLHERVNKKGVYITIGREHKMSILKTHSVITSNFNLGGVNGTIGVIGHTRMDYSKLISVVDYTSRIISQNWK
ncbi:MAG: heat-inducible transcription repressor HrcA [Fibrobacteria bacterium]|nr:heat-inducible transcription repressor HrcA [Fibrobacteria bacterium]